MPFFLSLVSLKIHLLGKKNLPVLWQTLKCLCKSNKLQRGFLKLCWHWKIPLVTDKTNSKSEPILILVIPSWLQSCKWMCVRVGKTASEFYCSAQTAKIWAISTGFVINCCDPSFSLKAQTAFYPGYFQWAEQNGCSIKHKSDLEKQCGRRWGGK